MNITEKLSMDRAGLEKNGPITIVAFGDSVTHGAQAEGVIDYETVYWNRLRQKLNAVRNYVPVNVINAGIGGITAAGSLDRMEQQVFSHDPDLVIISFGLNDVNCSLDEYLDALTAMFMRCNLAKVDTIFMTPNMLNTYVAQDTAPHHLAYAEKTAAYQNDGRMDAFMTAAVDLAQAMGIDVCDCYSKWKALSKTQDTTMLLANRINHPTAEMHALFADELFKVIFADRPEILAANNSTMFEG